MRIKSIDIHGFGIFSGFFCEKISEQLTIFLGENEAGKSTLMTFIRQMLFGFPTGRKNKPHRYPPLREGMYGGNLTFQLENRENITLRRHRNEKTTKDNITVQTDDGIKDEFFLKRILHPITNEIYLNILAFSLDELQEFRTLQRDELNEIFYNIDIGSGIRRVGQVKKILEKIIGEYYTKQSKKAFIDKRLKDLEVIQKKLRSREEIDEYDQEKEKLASLESKDNEIKEQCTKLENILKEHELFRGSVKPWNELQVAIKETSNFKNNLPNIASGDNSTLFEIAIRKLIEKKKSYADSQRDLPQVKEQVKIAESELYKKLHNLGSGWTVERVKNADISIQVRETVRGFNDRLTEIKNKIEQEHQKLELREEKIKEISFQLENAKKKLDDLPERTSDKKYTSAERKQKLNDFIDLSHKQNTLYANLEVEKERSQRLQLEKNQFISKSASFRHFLTLAATLALLGVVFGFWGFFEDNSVIWLFSIAFFVSALLIFVLNHIKKLKQIREKPLIDELSENLEKSESKKEELQKKVSEIEIRLNTISNELGFITHPELIEIRNELANCDKIHELEQKRKRYSEEFINAEEEEKRINSEKEKLFLLISESQDNLNKTQTEWKLWLKNHGFDEFLQPESMGEIFNLIDSIRQDHNVIDEKVLRIQQMQTEIEQLEQETDNLFIKAGVDIPDSVDCDEKIDILSYNWEQVKKLQNTIVDREMQLRNAAITEERYIWLKKRLENIYNFSELEQEIDTRQKELKEKQNVMRELKEEVGKIKKTLSYLEEEKNTASLLWQKNEIVSSLNKGAHEWTVNKIALFLLNKAQLKYQKERQPNVLKNASEYFSSITNNRYTAVIKTDDDEMFVLEKDGDKKDVSTQLSRGTAEELYFAMRLGYIQEFNKKGEPLPVIMDDIFVNMDDNRLPAAIRTLRPLTETNQVLVFTCHSKIAELISTEFPDTPIIKLHDGSLA